ncbi:histidine phosphatase family protein [Brevibacillus ginsengisoli]|uniref:histidine phosphatase family protein n=1 Tax=Brevibacillus ginsengisoli TaxID=363854 RepID=UPI003CF43B2F
MLLRKRLLLYLFFITFLLSSGLPTAAAEKLKEGNLSIIHELRNGGYILYMRHGDATIGQDRTIVDFNDCETQRNLSEEGKKLAKAIGQIFNKLKIPIHYPVLASPYCRTRETAGIAFGNQNVKIVPFLADILKVGRADIASKEKQNIVDKFTKMMEIAPPAGSNQIIIGHGFPSGTVLGEIPSMGTVLIKPKGQGNGYEIVRRINLDEFMRMTD